MIVIKSILHGEKWQRSTYYIDYFIINSNSYSIILILFELYLVINIGLVD